MSGSDDEDSEDESDSESEDESDNEDEEGDSENEDDSEEKEDGAAQQTVDTRTNTLTPLRLDTAAGSSVSPGSGPRHDFCIESTDSETGATRFNFSSAVLAGDTFTTPLSSDTNRVSREPTALTACSGVIPDSTVLFIKSTESETKVSKPTFSNEVLRSKFSTSWGHFTTPPNLGVTCFLNQILLAMASIARAVPSAWVPVTPLGRQIDDVLQCMKVNCLPANIRQIIAQIDH